MASAVDARSLATRWSAFWLLLRTFLPIVEWSCYKFVSIVCLPLLSAPPCDICATISSSVSLSTRSYPGVRGRMNKFKTRTIFVTLPCFTFTRSGKGNEVFWKGYSWLSPTRASPRRSTTTVTWAWTILAVHRSNVDIRSNWVSAMVHPFQHWHERSTRDK